MSFRYFGEKSRVLVGRAYTPELGTVQWESTGWSEKLRTKRY